MRYCTNSFYLLTICVVIFGNGCNPTTVPLKSKYNDKPTEFVTAKPVDSVWTNLNDIFNKNGIPIKKIDKNQGFIRTKKIEMNSIYTFENNNGQLEQPDAWVILMKHFNNEKEWKPKTIYSEWIIQVTEVEKGKAVIQIDPMVICTYYPNSFTKIESRGRSTGKLEELLEGYLNN